MDIFLAGKSRRLYNALPACAGLPICGVNPAHSECASLILAHLASEHPVSSAGQAFEQLRNIMRTQV